MSNGKGILLYVANKSQDAQQIVEQVHRAFGQQHHIVIVSTYEEGLRHIEELSGTGYFPLAILSATPPDDHADTYTGFLQEAKKHFAHVITIPLDQNTPIVRSVRTVLDAFYEEHQKKAESKEFHSSAILCVASPEISCSLQELFTTQLKSIDHIEVAETAEEALEIAYRCSTSGIDLPVVLADYALPNVQGDAFLIRLHQYMAHVKNILLIEPGLCLDFKKIISAAGLYRFIEKPWHDDDLLLTVQCAIQAHRQEVTLERQNQHLRKLNEELEEQVTDRTRCLELKNRALEQLAITDSLTGLCNRVGFNESLEKELHRAQRYQHPFALIMLDIDYFKHVNDSFGHQAGDNVLVSLAKLLLKLSRKTDLVARWGGEEFFVICPNTNGEGAFSLAEKIRIRLEQYSIPGVGPKTASFGVTEYRDGDTTIDMINRVDLALYTAKNNGRNRVERY